MKTNEIKIARGIEEINDAIMAGYIYHIEFGNAESDPMPGAVYMSKTIKSARFIYRKYAKMFDMALVKMWTGENVYGSEKQLFCGFTR